MNGFYSKKQFDNLNKKYDDLDNKYIYIYYVVEDPQNKKKIVQVTEVTKNSNILFDDAVNLGTVIKHLGSFTEYKSVDELNKLYKK
jgi:hypothetical protein